MEMPMDILNKRLGAIRDNGDIDFDNTAAAIDIDSELQEKFIFFPDAELSEIAEGIDLNRERLVLGQGSAHLNVPADISIKDAYTLAENALAIWWFVKHSTELDEARINRRPAPGVYRLWTGGEQHTAIVTADRRIICPTNRNEKMSDFTDIFDGLDSSSVPWVFTPIETGLSA